MFNWKGIIDKIINLFSIAKEEKSTKNRKEVDQSDKERTYSSKAPTKPNQNKSESKQAKDALPGQASKAGSRITIGLDFGTSTTKICARKEIGGDDVPIYPIKYKNDDTPESYLWPSLVSINNDNVYFSYDAKSENIFPYLKVCVACESEKFFNIGNCVYKDNCSFQKSNDFKSWEIAALFVAWIMKEARNRLPKEFNNSTDFIYNIGVPLKHLDNSYLHECYKRMSFIAWRISEEMQQGISLNKSLGLIKEMEKEKIPPPESSHVQLCPETSAAIVSFIKSPEALEGLYGIMDIGAWTTDISFFRLTDIEIQETGVRKLVFYSADVCDIATNAIDIAIIKYILERWCIQTLSQIENENLFVWIRKHREKNNWQEELPINLSTGNLERKCIPESIVINSKNDTAEAVCRFFTKTLDSAYDYERIPKRWESSLNLFIIGGGSCEGSFKEIIKMKDQERKYPLLKNGDVHSLIYSNLINATQSIRYRLGVAVGLSYPKAVWPNLVVPGDVTKWPLNYTGNITRQVRCRWCGGPPIPGSDTCLKCDN